MMNTEQQFWWNWVVQVAVAVATFLAVAAALFGDWFRSKLYRPELRLRLVSHEGEPGKIQHINATLRGVPEHFEAARYYHVRVSNERRYISPAKDAQVFLTRVEEPGPGGELQPTWFGEIPLTWRNPQISPVTRTIGHGYDCDLCSVGEDGWLSLSPLISPFNLNVRRTKACTMVVSLQARSTQTDSPICRIKLAWDGKWEAGESEMKRHLVITELLG